MLKKCFSAALILALALVVALPGSARAASDQQVQMLIQELKALKARVAELEKKLNQAQNEAHIAKQAASEARKTSSRSLKISQELSKTKESRPQGILSQAGKRLSFHGAVEVEANWERTEKKNGKDTTNSDITLATAELFVEATINRYTKGLLHFLWEQGDTEPVDIDEAFIVIGQTEKMPFYVMGGRIYPGFGQYESYFVSDPLTKEVFETQASALETGYACQWINFGVGAFNSEVAESSDGDDDIVNSFYAALQLQLPEGFVKGLDLHGGIAYINNVAASNYLRDQVPGQSLNSLVGGVSAMLHLTYGMATFTGEYITALDEFKAGELSFSGGKKLQPSAYNLELAISPWDAWTFAVKYEGTQDLASEFPERQWGLVASWQFLPDTTLSLEYLRGDFENDDTRDLVTTQLAVEF